MNRAKVRNSGAAPATVSSELLPIFTSLMRRRALGRPGNDDDLRARRPAATPKKRPRAGCPGGRLQIHAGVCRRAFDAASPKTSGLNNTTGSADVRIFRSHFSRSQNRSLVPVASRIARRAGRRASDAGDPPQRHGFEIRCQQDLGRDDQGVSRRRGPHRGGLAPGARGGGAVDRRGRRRAVAPDERRPHLSHRRRAGPGRTGADAQRAPQGGARLCAVPRRAHQAARRAGGRQIGQACGRTRAACDAGERHQSAARYRAARADRWRGLRRS